MLKVSLAAGGGDGARWGDGGDGGVHDFPWPLIKSGSQNGFSEELKLALSVLDFDSPAWILLP